MTKVGSPRMRWVSFVGLIMVLMSITPMGVAAQVGLTPTGDVAQDETATQGQAIEVHVVECVPDVPQDPSDLIPGCTEGPADQRMTVESVDPALGINQEKFTDKIGEGPGIINTGEIPVGDYRITIDLPVEDYRFFYECRTRESTTNDVAVTPVPEAANAFIVSSSADSMIVCQAWVTPLDANPTMEITYRECKIADMPGDGRSFEELQANCGDISTNPPTLTVREVNDPNNPVETEYTQEADGTFSPSLVPGNFEMFTDLAMQDWDEFLFCEYDGQPRYSKDFHPERGIVSFENLLLGEEFDCNWFAVNLDAATGDQPVENDDSTAQPPQDTGDDASSDEQPVENDDSAAQTPQDSGEGDVGATATDDVQFTINYKNCVREAFPNDDRSHTALVDNCNTYTGPGPIFTVVDGDESTQTFEPNEQGVVTFSHSAEPFSIYTNLDPNVWGEYLYCSFDEGEMYPKDFPPGGINSFSDLNAGEVFNCDWFGVQAPGAPDPLVPPADDDDDADTPPEETGTNTISVSAKVCEVGYEGAGPDALAQLQQDCVTPSGATLFTLTNHGDPQIQLSTNTEGFVVFNDVANNDWQLYSSVPLHDATEYYFCSTDGGDVTNIELNDGVAEFPGYQGESIECSMFIVPENLRGDVTGATLEVHLGICPTDYAGSNWYVDCHDNGTDGQEFTLTGPNGEVTEPAVVERTPGPAIASFTELPAGDYELRGGPPQDFGSVFLYCSDPSTGTQLETRFEGGMGYFSIAENQSVVCDWYFSPEDGQGETPTPTPEPELAEIFTTMFICPDGLNVAGSTFSQLDTECAERLNDIPMTLQSPGGVPIKANTGASGDGAVRFYDLTGGDYVLTPTLGSDFVSAAVYCDLDGGDVYQKALSNGATTFVNVEGELISCSWFVTAKAEPAPGPTGSITVREMLCEGDRSTIKDWERECQPGTSGVSFTIASSGGSVNQTLTPNDQGVAVFSGLPNEYYTLTQSNGAWCRAQAERVDAQSRVIVSNGGNTDVFLYQCNQEIGLPDTGAGPVDLTSPMPGKESILLGAAALPLFAIALWQIRRTQFSAGTVSTVSQQHEALTRIDDGYRYR